MGGAWVWVDSVATAPFPVRLPPCWWHFGSRFQLMGALLGWRVADRLPFRGCMLYRFRWLLEAGWCPPIGGVIVTPREAFSVDFAYLFLGGCRLSSGGGGWNPMLCHVLNIFNICIVGGS